MFPLIETIIAFSVIMLVLSFLIKSITSVIKNHFDFYSRNLENEVYLLLGGTLDKSKEQLIEQIRKDDTLQNKFPWLANNWKRLGEEYLTKKNIIWVLKQLDPNGATYKLKKELEGRLEVHVANVRYMFEKRMKNMTLAVGLALCLGLNINALTIWNKLYYDQDVRAKFASSEYVDSVVNMEEELKKLEKDYQSQAKETKEKEALKKQRDAVARQIHHLQGQVTFGMGKIWTENPENFSEKANFIVFEFLGSMLTGILVSIGAPYWHDLLRALGTLRKKKTEEKS